MFDRKVSAVRLLAVGLWLLCAALMAASWIVVLTTWVFPIGMLLAGTSLVFGLGAVAVQVRCYLIRLANLARAVVVRDGGQGAEVRPIR